MMAAWALGRLGSPSGSCAVAVGLGMVNGWSMEGKWGVNGRLIVDDFTLSF